MGGLIIKESDLRENVAVSSVKNKIILGDSLAVLKKMRSKSVSVIVTSPSYFLGKVYEKNQDFSAYLADHKEIIAECKRVLTDDGSIFWNVAQTIIDGEVVPLGALYYNAFKDVGFSLKNWIIWKFEGGETPSTRLFGRYENVLWFVKNKNNYTFNLDSVRIPAKWIADKRCNALGKNPEDFWLFDERTNFEKLTVLREKIAGCKALLSKQSEGYVNQIHFDELFREIDSELQSLLDSKDEVTSKNLRNNIWHINRVVNVSKAQKIKHPASGETHPCPFPERMIERIIKMSTNENDLVLDIFAGSGTVCKVAHDLKRNWIGIDKERKYCEIAEHRLISNCVNISGIS